MLRVLEGGAANLLLPSPSLEGNTGLLAPGVSAALSAVKMPLQNLPRPDHERFIGRQRELAEVHRLLLPETRHFSICVDGIGGVGKSAMVLEAAYRYLVQYDALPAEQRFEAIIWTSAKERVLTGEGITSRAKALHAVEDIYTTIAIVLNREDIRRAKPEEQNEMVRHALTQQRSLLIVDNLDTIDDDRVLNFIRELPAPTKAIITTRHWRDIAYPIRLDELDESDAFTLIADEAKTKGVPLTGDEMQQLYQTTKGLPLAIVWSVALMGFNHDVAMVLELMTKSDSELARFCFEESVAPIRSKPAYQLLMALSLFATDASRDALGYIGDVSEPSRREALIDLEKLSLVNRNSDRYRCLELTRVYAKGDLSAKPGLHSSYRERWIGYWLNLLGAPRQTHYERLELVRLEFRNILAALDYCWVAVKLDTLIELAIRMEFYFRITGNWVAWNTYTELALEAAPALGAARGALAEADLSYSLAKLRTSQGDLDIAENLLNKAIKAYRIAKDDEGSAFAIWWLGSIQSERGDLVTARKSQNKAQRIARRLKHQVLLAYIERQLGLIEANEGNYASAEKRLLRSAEWQGLGAHPSQGLILLYLSLGTISLRKPVQDLESARQYFQQALDIAQVLNIPVNLATAKLYLAELERKLGNIDQAHKLAREAMEGFTVLGMKQDIIRTQTLLDEIPGQSDKGHEQDMDITKGRTVTGSHAK